MSDSQWFYSDARQQQQGPVSFAQIQEMAASGQIQPTTLIWNEGMSNWTAANQVNGVFNQATPPAGSANPYATPNAGAPVMARSGGDYPIPTVKRCSFPLFLVTYVLALVLLVVAVAPFAPAMVEVIREAQTISADYESSPETREANQAETEQRMKEKFEEIFTPEKVMLFGVLMLLSGTLGIFSWVVACIHIHRSWSLLQPGGARTTPGKAVGFLFIPLFNLYWVFVAYYGWAKDWNRIQGGYQNLSTISRVPDTLFLIVCISYAASLFPVLGYAAILVSWILFPVMLAKMCKVVNQMAATKTP